MNKLIDISYFIKNSNFQNNKELFPNDNFIILKPNDLIFQDYCESSSQLNNPFKKIQKTPHQLKSNIKSFNPNYYNGNDINIKRKLLENSLPFTRNLENKNIKTSSSTVNEGIIKGRNKIDFPLLKSMSINNIIKGTNGTSLLLNANEENNLKKNEEIINRYMNLLSIKQIKPKAKNNMPKIQFKFNDKSKEERIKINDSLRKLRKIFNDSNKFTYKSRYLFKLNQLKLNNIINTSKSVRTINDKIEMNNQKNDIKIKFPPITNTQIRKSLLMITNIDSDKKEINNKRNSNLIDHINTEKIYSNISSPKKKSPKNIKNINYY